MYGHFTDRARKVMQLANQVAKRFKHGYVGTEHILLGLVEEGNNFAASVLNNLGVDLRKIRLEVEKLVQSGPDIVTMDKLPWTTRAKNVIEYALEEARNLGHNYVSCEYLLLGLLRENEGVAAQVLMNLGLRLENVRAQLGGIVQRAEEERTEGCSPWFPLLHKFHDEAGEPDPRVLSVLPKPLMPPIKIVVGTVPRFPVSTLKAVLPLDDTRAPYFQALVPLISPESVARFRDNHRGWVQLAFDEIKLAEHPTSGCPALLCVVRPMALSQDVRAEVLAGLYRTNCDFVVFEDGERAHSIFNLPPGTKLLEV